MICKQIFGSLKKYLKCEKLTAADTAPNPINEMYDGVKYCSTNGKILLSSLSLRG